MYGTIFREAKNFNKVKKNKQKKPSKLGFNICLSIASTWKLTIFIADHDRSFGECGCQC